MFLGIIPFIIIGIQAVSSCRNIEIMLGSKSVVLQQVSLSDHWSLNTDDNYFSGRPVYRSDNKEYIIFHEINMQSGIGRWILSKTLKHTTATSITDMVMIAYAESWAITPYLIDLNIVADNNMVAGWKYMSGSGAKVITLACMGDVVTALQNVLFFDSSTYLQPGLSGFYIRHYPEVEHSLRDYDNVVFMQIREGTSPRPVMYLFPLFPRIQQQSQTCSENRHNGTCSSDWPAPATTTTWLIGEEPGQDSGLAYVSITSTDTGTALEQLLQQAGQGKLYWHFVRPSPAESNDFLLGGRDDDSVWVRDASSELLIAQNNSSIYTVLRAHRAVKNLPEGQSSLMLRNGLPIPMIGLGTGGIYLEHTAEVLSNALGLGYRLLDLAREYGNERLAGQTLRHGKQLQHHNDRTNVFIQSKVWPTQLGFLATQRALSTSLVELDSTYIDMYMLHWPRCDASIEWMRCWDTEDPAGTWLQSYRALEKAYAEGRVMSIGVSNFDLSLLEYLHSEVATVLPHLIQNWAEPGRTDKAVRLWCKQHDTVYQPYAPLRNLAFLSSDLQQTLLEIALRYNASVQSVVLQFFLQLDGVSVIPRSSQYQHLAANLQHTSWQLSEQEMLLLTTDS